MKWFFVFEYSITQTSGIIESNQALCANQFCEYGLPIYLGKDAGDLVA